eukprot:TRINITY_DN11369_c0_g1_i1.p1 TRINITY_DN11369_c0_g1~~TRINITY_DN11369_c0_g1_i1.p1  ORF type:complete len:373 (-),score=110.60 TRINITY_DN11369_c0_g1_i1:52-1098(-)
MSTIYTSINQFTMKTNFGKSANGFAFTAEVKQDVDGEITTKIVKVKQYNPCLFFNSKAFLDPSLSREEIALQVITSQPERFEKVRRAFIEAGERMNELNGQGLAKFVGVLAPTDELNFGIVTEVVRGDTLNELVTSDSGRAMLESLPLEVKLQMLGDIAHGLQALESFGVIHGNLHNCNVVLNTEEGTAHVIDYFGSFLSLDFEENTDEERGDSDNEEEEEEEDNDGEDDGEEEDEKSPFATNKNYKLTKLVDFEAPVEYHLMQSMTTASDVYCFSMIAWQLLSANVPFVDVIDRYDLKIKIVRDGLRPDLKCLNVPADVCDMISKCWNFLPSKRLQLDTICQILNRC